MSTSRHWDLISAKEEEEKVAGSWTDLQVFCRKSLEMNRYQTHLLSSTLSSFSLWIFWFCVKWRNTVCEYFQHHYVTFTSSCPTLLADVMVWSNRVGVMWKALSTRVLGLSLLGCCRHMRESVDPAASVKAHSKDNSAMICSFRHWASSLVSCRCSAAHTDPLLSCCYTWI